MKPPITIRVTPQSKMRSRFFSTILCKDIPPDYKSEGDEFHEDPKNEQEESSGAFAHKIDLDLLVPLEGPDMLDRDRSEHLLVRVLLITVDMIEDLEDIGATMRRLPSPG